MFNKNDLKKPVLVAELCQNHLGSLSLLKEMICAASESGVKYLKIQDINSKKSCSQKEI